MKTPAFSTLSPALCAAFGLLAAPSASIAADTRQYCGQPNGGTHPPPNSCEKSADQEPAAGHEDDADGPTPEPPQSSDKSATGSEQTSTNANTSGSDLKTSDITLSNTPGSSPFGFAHHYRSRDITANSDQMGHGRTLTHSYTWRMWSSGTNGANRSIMMPGGHTLDFAPYPGTIDFEGQTSVKYIPQASYGERLYQVGEMWYLLVPGGERHAFERVTAVDGSVRYHPRSYRDGKGNLRTYLTDDQARITEVSDAAGNWIRLAYAGIEVDRKKYIPIHTITAAPVLGWNEVNVTTTQPFRWVQGISAPDMWFRMAEIEFHAPVAGGGTLKLGGTAYGTAPDLSGGGYNSFHKAFDGNVSTGYAFARPNGGIAGMDFGSGSESHVAKIRFFIHSANADRLNQYIGHQFVGCVSAPEIITVLTEVTSSAGHRSRFNYQTVTDASIGQSHLVLSGIDHVRPAAAGGADTTNDDSSFSWATVQQGSSPTATRLVEPRSGSSTPDLAFDYYPATLAVKGQISRVKSGNSGALFYSVDRGSNYFKTTSPNGGVHTVSNTNGSAFLPASSTDASGMTTNYTWNSSQYLASETTPAGTTSYTRNYMGQPLTITRPDGLVTTYTYDVQGRLLSRRLTATGQAQRLTTWTRDSNGRVTRTTYPDGSFQQFTYNALGRVTLVREKNGSYTRHTYDASGLRLSTTRGLPTSTATSGGETTTFTYYPSGATAGSHGRKLQSTTDPRGRTTSWTYDAAGRILTTTYPDSSVRSVQYDAIGNRIAESDGMGLEEWTYDDFRRVHTHTNALGGVTTYDYSLSGASCSSCYGVAAPTLITSPGGRKTRRQYDLKSRLIQEIRGNADFSQSVTTSHTRDALGRIVATTDPDGFVTTFTYDPAGRTLSTTRDPAGLNLTTTHTYSPFGDRLSTTAPGNRTTSATYDTMGRVVTSTDALGLVTRATYNPAGLRTASTRGFGTALARTTTFTYDLLDRPTAVLHPDGSTTSQTYHPGGELHTRTDELGRVTVHDSTLLTWSDSDGNSWTTFASSATDPAGATGSTYATPMAAAGGTRRTISPLGRVSETHLDELGRTVEVRNGLIAAGSSLAADPSITRIVHDPDGLALSTTVDPAGLNQTTSTAYDFLGRAVTVTDPLGRITTYTYDKRGNRLSTTLPGARTSTATYDALGRQLSTTDPKNQTISYTWWHETGNMLTLTDARNHSTQWTYNLRGQLLAKIYPNFDTHTYAYDLLGRLASHTTPKLEVCTYSYDLRDRQLLADWNSATPDTARSYFANGQLKSIDNGVSRSDYSYDSRNLLSAEIQTLAGQTGRSISYSHDADGLRLRLDAGLDQIVDYTWTVRGQLASLAAAGPPPLAQYAYDKAGRGTALHHENGITEQRSYDAAGQLLANEHLKSGALVGGHGYTLDPAGRRVGESFLGATGTPARSYGYDLADQVTSASYGGGQSDSYAYDAMGNRESATLASLGGTTTSYTANNANQYTAISGWPAPVHDANGNLLQQNGVTYTWDSENRLLSLQDATRRTEFSYDGLHRRVTKKVILLAGSVVESHVHYLYDGWNPIRETSLLTPAQRTDYTWGSDLSGSLQGAGGVGGLLLAEVSDGSGTIARHFHYDGNGNVTEVTDLAGNNLARYRYDAFGNTLVATGTHATANKYRFSTKPLDHEIPNAQLYYYGYRYYDPVTGRWPSRDPIEEQGGDNLHGFAFNDPLDYIDVLGNAPKIVRQQQTNRRRQENETNRRNNEVNSENRSKTEDVIDKVNENSEGEIRKELPDRLKNTPENDVSKILDDPKKGVWDVGRRKIAESTGRRRCEVLINESGIPSGCGCCIFGVKSWRVLVGGIDHPAEFMFVGATVHKMPNKDCKPSTIDNPGGATMIPTPESGQYDVKYSHFYIPF